MKKVYINILKRKFSLLFLLMYFFSQNVFSQKKLPIVKASSHEAEIYEAGSFASGWNISPQIKPDVFTTNKLTRPTIITFKTNSDSISFKIGPGQIKDFIVLLNGKDSCYTTIQSPVFKDFSKIEPEFHDSIQLTINEHNTIYVKGILNKTDTLDLNFDTGTTELTITRDVLKNKIKSDPKLYNTLYELQIGKRIYKTKVYDAALTGHETDGRFGWDLFDGMIVELNYDKNIMIVHSRMPDELKKDKGYTKLSMKYFKNLFLTGIEMSQNGIKNKDWFLFDIGYQRTVMLDNDLLKQNNFPTEKMEVIKNVMMHGASGNEIPVVTANLKSLQIGKYELKNVPAQILTTNKPMRGTNIHIVGNEVLKRFNTILDFQNNAVYLKPNSFFNATYAESR